MAISDFVSGRGWEIDVINDGNFLRVRDRLYIASFGNQNVFLIFERDRTTIMEGRACYYPNLSGGRIGGLIMGYEIALQFDGDGNLEITYSTGEGGESPNGGGTSSGPGGN